MEDPLLSVLFLNCLQNFNGISIIECYFEIVFTILMEDPLVSVLF